MSRFPDNEIRITVTEEESSSSSSGNQGNDSGGSQTPPNGTQAPGDQTAQEDLFRIVSDILDNLRGQQQQAPGAGINSDEVYYDPNSGSHWRRGRDGRFSPNPASGGEGNGGGGGNGNEDNDGNNDKDPEIRWSNAGESFFTRIGLAVSRAFGRWTGSLMGRTIGGRAGGVIGSSVGNVTGQAAARAMGAGGGAVGGGVGAGGAGAGGAGVIAAGVALGMVAAVAALLAGLAAIQVGVVRLGNELTKELSQLNAQTAAATGLTQAYDIMSRIEQANETSTELSRFIYAQNELNIAVRELKVELFQLLEPFAETVMVSITALVKTTSIGVEWLQDASVKLGNAVAPFFDLIPYVKEMRTAMGELLELLWFLREGKRKGMERDFFEWSRKFQNNQLDDDFRPKRMR